MIDKKLIQKFKELDGQAQGYIDYLNSNPIYKLDIYRKDVFSANKELFLQQIRMANGGKIKIKKAKKWLYPMAAERLYEKQLIEVNRIFWDEVKKTIIPQLPFLVEQAKSIRPDAAEIKLDYSWFESLKQLTEKTYFDFSAAVGQPRVSAIADDQAQRINSLNKKEFIKVIHSAVAVNPIVHETWLPDQMKAFSQNNVNLITKLGSDQRERLQQNLYNNLSAGNGIDAIKEDLIKSESIGKNRARLIARDQTNKFNGQLSELRQTEIGIGSYIWTTARDERVRPTHRENEGKVFSWKNPPNTGHPGSEIQCRCIPQPVITDAMFDSE